MTDAPSLTCPSAPCAPGATLVGVVGADGRVDYLRTPMQIDAGFVSSAQRQGAPETRMRFAASCHKSDCTQWTGEGCGVVRRVLSHLEQQPQHTAAPDLQPCVIRASCRWYFERAEAACKACKMVITDQTSTPEAVPA